MAWLCLRGCQAGRPWHRRDAAVPCRAAAAFCRQRSAGLSTARLRPACLLLFGARKRCAVRAGRAIFAARAGRPAAGSTAGIPQAPCPAPHTPAEKQLRKRLEGEFGVQLGDRKALLRAEINAYLEAQVGAGSRAQRAQHTLRQPAAAAHHCRGCRGRGLGWPGSRRQGAATACSCSVHRPGSGCGLQPAGRHRGKGRVVSCYPAALSPCSQTEPPSHSGPPCSLHRWQRNEGLDRGCIPFQTPFAAASLPHNSSSLACLPSPAQSADEAEEEVDDVLEDEQPSG